MKGFTFCDDSPFPSFVARCLASLAPARLHPIPGPFVALDLRSEPATRAFSRSPSRQGDCEMSSFCVLLSVCSCPHRDDPRPLDEPEGQMLMLDVLGHVHS